MTSRTSTTLFTGCSPEVAVDGAGRILATGSAARAAAGRGARVHRLRGRAYAGFGDAHLHLEWLARAQTEVPLGGATTRREILRRIAARAGDLPADAWVLGSGWYNDEWQDDPSMPRREELDAVAGGRPVLIVRKDGHSSCLSTAALQATGFTRSSPDPPAGVVDRDAHGEPTGMVREAANGIAQTAVPVPDDATYDTALAAVLRDLARRGLTSVHTMDGPALFRSLQRLRRAGTLPIRVVWNLPLNRVDEAIALGVTSGLGDEHLRIWGVKAFLDGSLGSRTAEMLDGTGVTVLEQPAVLDLVHRCAAAHLNVCLHAIGDGAVRRALDALETVHTEWPLWRPRIEHAQCVHPDDVDRFARLGVIASMQPVHAVSDRAIADELWGERAAHAYAWGALHRAGAMLAFGSDAPVEEPDPLAGISAATTWRRRASWYPDLAVSRAVAIGAYSRGVAYAAGMEHLTGTLRRGMLADLTVVDGDEVVAAIVSGRVVA